jgi:sedoheptulose-bisphosphatase
MSKAPELHAFLEAHLGEGNRGLTSVVDAIASSCAKVAVALRTTLVAKAQTTNDFGDEVLTVDLVADKLICTALAACPDVAAYSSEEHPELTPGTVGGSHTVTFDPLDGSSIIDTNFSVGAIFAVWRGTTPVGQRVRDIDASVVCVFGPRCMLFVAHPAFGVNEFMLCADTAWHMMHKKPLTIAPRAKIFSPGNLRAANDHPGYLAYLSQCVREKQTLRYTGGMVPDVMQILVKGNGIFTTPQAPGHKMKLRVCFECGPISHMVTLAGGAATLDGVTDYLDVVVLQLDQRSSVAMGSRDAVEQYSKAITAPQSKL